MNKIISFIIPVYNLEEYLEKCVLSIIENCSSSYIEVLIINDGSSDDSLKIALELSQKDNRVNVLDVPNGGVCKARNLGLSLAKGKYISFVDADDYISTDFNILLNELKNNFELFICKSFTIESNGLSENYFFPKSLESIVLSGKELFQVHNFFRGSVAGVIFNRKFIISNNLSFFESLKNSEDTIFFFLSQYYANKIKFLNLDFYRVFRRFNSASNNYSFGACINQIKSIIIFRDYCKERKISVNKSPLLSFLIYILISNSMNRFVKVKGGFTFTNIKQFLSIIEESQLIPLNLQGINFKRGKISLLNTSPFLSFLLLKLRR